MTMVNHEAGIHHLCTRPHDMTGSWTEAPLTLKMPSPLAFLFNCICGYTSSSLVHVNFLQYFCSCEPGPIIQPWWHDWWRRLRPFGWCAPGMWFLSRNGGRNLRTLGSVCVKQLCKTGLHLAPQSRKDPGISFPTAKRTVSAKTSKLGEGKCWTSNPMMPKPFHGSCSTLVGFERFWGRGNFYGARRAFALLWLPLVVCLADLSSPVWKHFLPRNKKLRRIQRVASMQSMYVLQRTETTKHSKCWGLTGTDGRRAKSLRMQTPSLNFKLDLQ